MKSNCPFSIRNLRFCALVFYATLTAIPVQGHPYASGISNNAGTISFILNEKAESIKVAFDNNTVTNTLAGQTNAGVQSFALGGHTNFSIIVSKAGSGSISQVSVNATNNSFFGPRGVGVNR